ncbi:MAG: DEAD/DEAH box helicase [Deltaproteobacteria bacterium]|nr:DEAD/DEAH box helicase [Deltaproteobacteria bacterium]MBW2253552.1 DEAD/DEAH box helicase [Deltaproteobacteria bacterium]
MDYRGFALDAFQEAAIRHLKAGSSVLVSAPTGNGKTIIADWIVEEALREGKQVIYTAPVKALSNQKFRDYTRLHGDDNVGLVTGDLVIRPDAPCRVMTTEILRNMLLAGQEFTDLLAVVIDEIHFLDDPERGTVWEEVLIYLPPDVQIVGLSATLSNLDNFAAWLSEVREREVRIVRAEERIVPLTFHYACRELGLCEPRDYHEQWKRKRRSLPRDRGQRRRFRGSSRNTRDTHLFRMLLEAALLPYLYFVFSRRDTELFARDLARTLDRTLLRADEQVRLHARLTTARRELGPALDPAVAQMYERGVAFHHAGLHVGLKALVEELYEQKLIKVLYCTSTFALGINMPARAVVFDGINKFDGTRVAPLTTRGFMQKAGRAGRRGMDEVGHVVVRVELEDYAQLRPLLERYQRAEYEPVRSSFSLSWNSIVNLLARMDEDQIREVVEKSFLSWWLARRAGHHIAQASHLENLAAEGGKRAHRQRKDAARLRKRATRAGSRVWDEFQVKVAYLRRIAYLDPDNGFNAGARVLQHVQIEELPVTELLLAGVLDELGPTDLFGVLCALTNELGRHVDRNFKLTRNDRRLIRRIEEVCAGPPVLEADALAGTESGWDPDLLPIGRAWAEGRSLQEILRMVSSTTDISGDLITGFRRAKDLAGQLRDVWRQDPERVEMVTRLIRSVSRDEVEVVD